ncbi:hypothetical protein LWI28_002126 [Acer negundo]|uniref:Uncharacterized protein n=1 Tax=Acer negundo TaxID=4023 RepID=A0AAD5JFR0_ACENE|nr:hypothetical protein LWI28_002126 [Acer negundo]
MSLRPVTERNRKGGGPPLVGLAVVEIVEMVEKLSDFGFSEHALLITRMTITVSCFTRTCLKLDRAGVINLCREDH